MDTSLKKIAVFIKQYSIGKSAPVLCLLDLLSDNYEVDLFVRNVWYTNATVLKKSTIRLIEVATGPETKEEEGSLVNRFTKLFSFPFMKKYRTNREPYCGYISFDPHGFIFCKELFPEARPIYYSLELYFRDNHFNLAYPEEVMNKERAEINSIRGLIIQSQERETLFREEYHLSDKIPALLLPITYSQPSVKEKSFILRKRYNIHDKMIALHLGGIQEYHSCIELALAFSGLDKWVLVFHGDHFGEYIERLRNTIKEHSLDNVIISDKTYELIEDMDEVLMSSDVGIAWYNDVSPNFTTAGKSSGKISAYLRFGLPVVANKYRSTVEAIEQTGCGICVNDFSEIKGALTKIERDYNDYSSHCRDEYDRAYWFENHKTRILEFLKKRVSDSGNIPER